MENDKIWSFFINLGYRMWPDPWGSRNSKRPPQCSDWFFDTELSTERDVWHRVVDSLPSFGVNTLVIDVGEGVRYDSHPELAIPGTWSKDELRAELDHIRSLGIEPIPKLNFSACHDAWLGEYAYMLSTKKYYEVAHDLISETSELFGHPSLFHLGMDEEDFSDHSTGVTIIRSPELWWHDMNFLIDEVEKAGSRPWIWRPYSKTTKPDFGERMTHDIVLSSWCYNPLKPRDPATGLFPQMGLQAYIDFAKNGFDQIPCVSDCYCRTNAAETVWFFAEEDMINEHLLGFVQVPWARTNDLEYYSLMENVHRLKYAKQLYADIVSGKVKVK